MCWASVTGLNRPTWAVVMQLPPQEHTCSGLGPLTHRGEQRCQAQRWLPLWMTSSKAPTSLSLGFLSW